MQRRSHTRVLARLRRTLVVISITALWHAQAFPQTRPTTEYIRGAGRVLAVLHGPPVHFTDMQGYDQYAAEADLLYLEGVSSGCQPYKYCPTDQLTRETMAVFVIAALYAAKQGPGHTTPAEGWTTHSQYFTDVPPSSPYYNFIQQMAYLGITGGCAPSLFCPSRATSNVEMAVFTMAARQVVLTGAVAGVPTPTGQCFTDVPPTDFYYKWVQGLVNLDVIPALGTAYCGGTFSKDKPIIRAYATAYIARGILGDQSF